MNHDMLYVGIDVHEKESQVGDIVTYLSGCSLQRPVAVIALQGSNSGSAGFNSDLSGWAALEGCAATPTVTYQPSNTTAASWPPNYGIEAVRQETYTGCSAGMSLILYIVGGSSFPPQTSLGDAWPRTSTSGIDPKSVSQLGSGVFHSSYVDGGELVWSFFQQHPHS